MTQRKINLIFMILMIATVVACAIHITISYICVANDMSTSFPPTIAFFLLIPYVFALVVELIVWLSITLVKRKKLLNENV